MSTTLRAWLVGVLGAALGAAGCGPSGDAEAPDQAGDAAAEKVAVVYAALDEEFSRPILEAYGASSGVDVQPKYDTESTKTVGLTNLIIAEAGRPRCDLFWNNEILNTIRLKQKGLLQPFRPANAENYPEEYRDAKDGMWYGFAARARILLVNTQQVNDRSRPRSIEDLTAPAWKGKVGIAKPLFGTTATHAACLFQFWGEQRAEEYFRALKGNEVKVFSGNKQVAKAVASGEIAVGLTDTDDAIIELDAGQPVAIVYPDLGQGQMGTLFIPNTLCVPKGAPHAEAAAALAGHLLGPAIEASLAEGPSAQIPLGRNATAQARIESPRTVRAMAVDFEAAAQGWDKAADFLAREFAGP